MAAAPVDVRCPACGQTLRVVLASAPPTQWFPCPQCHLPVPVVVPRDPPPLFTWEVLPGLYPALPPPRIPRWRARSAVAVALAVVTVAAAAFGGLLVYWSVLAAGPSEFTVDGHVFDTTAGGPVPANGALVVLHAEGNQVLRATVGPDGSFDFRDVPAGGVVLNVSQTGYVPASVSTFVSTVYDAGTTGLSVTLTPGSGNVTVSNLSPFTDLESFLAALGGAAVVLGLVALIAGLATVATVRADRPALGVVGGSAGLLTPLALHFLSLDTIFPLALYGLSVAAAFGGFVVGLRAIEIAQTSPAAGPD
ncbi:MAG TPA: carboxypeptidase regulatory-like domain-containing protein [Thermoplasmata archaeon]|nr:carboxypeptidase regulatory-like domain-containing protein [Thermoplasmata archaeon]